MRSFRRSAFGLHVCETAPSIPKPNLSQFQPIEDLVMKKRRNVLIIWILFLFPTAVFAQETICSITTSSTIDHGDSLPIAVANGDFDGDGILDLATLGGNQQDESVDPRVSIYLSTETEPFLLTQSQFRQNRQGTHWPPGIKQKPMSIKMAQSTCSMWLRLSTC